MTTLLYLAARASGLEGFSLQAEELGRFLDRIPFRYPRFPAWFPQVGGATHPWAARAGLRAYIRHLKGRGIAFTLQPVLRARQTATDLADALHAGHPTLIYGVGQTGIPHVVAPLER